MFDVLKAIEKIHKRAMKLPYEFSTATWNLDPLTYVELRKADPHGHYFSHDTFKPPTLTAWPVCTRKIHRIEDMSLTSADWDPKGTHEERRCLYLEVEQKNGRKIYLDDEITAEEYLTAPGADLPKKKHDKHTDLVIDWHVKYTKLFNVINQSGIDLATKGAMTVGYSLKGIGFPYANKPQKWKNNYGALVTRVHAYSDRIKKLELAKLTEAITETGEACPECGAPLKDGKGGGVKCTKCRWWFCY